MFLLKTAPMFAAGALGSVWSLALQDWQPVVIALAGGAVVKVLDLLLARANKQSDGVQSYYQELRAEVQQLRTQTTTLQNENINLNRVILGLEKTVAKVELERDRAKEQAVEMLETMAAKDAEVLRMRGQMTQMQHQLDELSRRVPMGGE